MMTHITTLIYLTPPKFPTAAKAKKIIFLLITVITLITHRISVIFKLRLDLSILLSENIFSMDYPFLHFLCTLHFL